jgi:hypothetical protein
MKPNIMLIFLRQIAFLKLKFQADEKKRTWPQMWWLRTPSLVCIYLCMSKKGGSIN